MLAEKDDTMCSAAKSIYEIFAEQEAQLEQKDDEIKRLTAELEALRNQ